MAELCPPSTAVPVNTRDTVNTIIRTLITQTVNEQDKPYRLAEKLNQIPFDLI